MTCQRKGFRMEAERTVRDKQAPGSCSPRGESLPGTQRRKQTKWEAGRQSQGTARGSLPGEAPPLKGARLPCQLPGLYVTGPTAGWWPQPDIP